MRITKLMMALWLAVAVAMVAAAGLAFWQRTAGPVAAVSGASALRADFELTDHRGMVQTDEDLRGEWLLVFFGFTNCPDVCPMGLATIARAMDELGDEAQRVQPLFISVDPERDTPGVLAEYVQLFHPAILGLSASPEKLQETAENFAIFYEKVEEASAPDGYTMAHTSSILLFDPEGEFVRLFGYDASGEDIAADLRERIGA